MLCSRLDSLAGSGWPSARKARDSVAAAKMLGVKGNYLLPADCAHRWVSCNRREWGGQERGSEAHIVPVLRVVVELQGALDSCADRQRQLERSLRVSRRLLQVWYADSGTSWPVPPRTISIMHSPRA